MIQWLFAAKRDLIIIIIHSQFIDILSVLCFVSFRFSFSLAIRLEIFSKSAYLALNRQTFCFVHGKRFEKQTYYGMEWCDCSLGSAQKRTYNGIYVFGFIIIRGLYPMKSHRRAIFPREKNKAVWNNETPTIPYVWDMEWARLWQQLQNQQRQQRAKCLKSLNMLRGSRGIW